MLSRTLVSSCIVLLSAWLVTAQDVGPAPTLTIVRQSDPAKGHVFFRKAMTVSKNVPVTEKVNVNGQVIDVTKIITVPTTENVDVAYDIAASRVITPDGKQLALDEALKRLKANTVVAISADGKTPSSQYLKALHPDTLVIIPGLPQREPAPPK